MKLHTSIVTLSKSQYCLQYFVKGSELQTASPMDQRNQYIDPGNYMDLMELISKFTNELNRSDTKLEGVIGQGRYYSLIQWANLDKIKFELGSVLGMRK